MKLALEHLPRRAKPRSGRRIRGLDLQRPTYHFDFSSQSSFSRLVEPNMSFVPNFAAQAYQLPFCSFSSLAARRLTATEADFLHFCFALYFADRFSPRRPFGPVGPSFLRRKISVRLPAREPGIWLGLNEEISEMLLFLTGDDWCLDFVPRRYQYSAEEQDHCIQKNEHPFAVAALFSGGLDSLAGLLSVVPTDEEHVLLISGQTHNRLAAAQAGLIASIRQTVSVNLTHFGFRYGMEEILERSGMDSTQRCRGLVHVGAGLLAASLAGVCKLHLFENGIGALNLPCDVAQFGAQNSRSAHPIFLNLLSKLASKLLQRDISIVNPALMMTKGQMILALDSPRVQSLLVQSFSCEFFPNYHSRERQCGACPSCLVRRAALAIAQVPSSMERYTFGQNQDEKVPEGRRLGYVKLNRFVDRLSKGLDTNDSWSGLIREFPELFEWMPRLCVASGYSEAQLRVHLIKLFSAFCREWRAFRHSDSAQPYLIAA